MVISVATLSCLTSKAVVLTTSLSSSQRQISRRAQVDSRNRRHDRPVAVADFGARTVAVDENVQCPMQIGEAVVDRQKIIDVPLIGDGWAREVRAIYAV